MGETVVFSQSALLDCPHRRKSSSAGKPFRDAESTASLGIRLGTDKSNPAVNPNTAGNATNASTTVSTQCRPQPQSAFLCLLPLELRLQVYAAVYQDQPDGGAQVMTVPWLPDLGRRCLRYWSTGGKSVVEEFRLVESVSGESGESVSGSSGGSVSGSTGGSGSTGESGSTGGSVSGESGSGESGSGSPVARMLPTALLLTSRQVYCEARHIPFVTNEYVFEKCSFASALNTAHAFAVLGGPSSRNHPARRLWPWQRERVRRMKLELDVGVVDVGVEDVDKVAGGVEDGVEDVSIDKVAGVVNSSVAGVNSSPPLLSSSHRITQKWIQLCDALPGLHTLRLSLSVDVDPDHTPTRLTPASVGSSLLARGLYRLPALRRLEVDVVFDQATQARLADDAKRTRSEFCGALEKVLNERAASCNGHPVRVICMERVPVR